MQDERWILRSRIRLEGGVDEETGVLCDTHNADMCACNGTAWLIVNILQAGATLAEVTNAVIDRYNVPEEIASGDALRLIQQLDSMELIDVKN